ncbi:MAG: urea amidolyase [Pseudomonadota bacterium]
MSGLRVNSIGPSVTVQDQGRPGFVASGLSRGGAVDLLALSEGAALLGQGDDLAALEMAGFGGTFTAECDLRIALTGAAMQADLDGVPLTWNASHTLSKGATLRIGAAPSGGYGYLHLGGGIDAPIVIGARSTHLNSQIGRRVAEGDLLLTGPDKGGPVGQVLQNSARDEGGTIRMVRSFQTPLFAEDDLARFEATVFHRDMRGNRMGVQLNPDGAGFQAEGGLTVLSEIIMIGDVQMTGDGAPFVLLPEAQTTGGYPRIGTILPCDLPKLVQARPDAGLRFTFVEMDEALDAERAFKAHLAALPQQIAPLIRAPGDVTDLLTYQLISGVARGDEEA